MHTKTWNIGEYAKGGVITVEINENNVAIIGKIWDTSKGWNKNSDQSNAKEFIRREQNIMTYNGEWILNSFLCDLTTSYYADIIMTWIKSKL